MSQKLNLEEVNFNSKKSLKYRSYQSPTNKQLEPWWLRMRILKKNVGFKLVGQKRMLHSLLMGLITGGHVLLEGPPGVGKTTAINTLSELIDCKLVLAQTCQDFIGANLIVANELDRANDSFRKALLDAMQEKEVVIGSDHFYLDLPFVVFSTINPREDQRIPLLKAELDRFMFYHRVSHPSYAEELQILANELTHNEAFSKSIDPVLDAKDLLEVQRLVHNLQFDNFLMERIAETMTWARKQQYNKPWSGFSTRTTINWARAACANAFLAERSKVELTDLIQVMQSVLCHLLPHEYQSNDVKLKYIASMQEVLES